VKNPLSNQVDMTVTSRPVFAPTAERKSLSVSSATEIWVKSKGIRFVINLGVKIADKSQEDIQSVTSLHSSLAFAGA
jgi:hypothetical protein